VDAAGRVDEHAVPGGREVKRDVLVGVLCLGAQRFDVPEVEGPPAAVEAGELLAESVDALPGLETEGRPRPRDAVWPLVDLRQFEAERRRAVVPPHVVQPPFLGKEDLAVALDTEIPGIGTHVDRDRAGLDDDRLLRFGHREVDRLGNGLRVEFGIPLPTALGGMALPGFRVGLEFEAEGRGVEKLQAHRDGPGPIGQPFGARFGCTLEGHEPAVDPVGIHRHNGRVSRRHPRMMGRSR